MNIGIALLLALAASGVAGAASAKPNIVYLIADDLGYGDVQCLNPERGKIRTPHLDRLAREGMTFTDCHSGSSVCTPTRYGVLTGRYAWRTRLQAGVLDGFVAPLIAGDRLTVPAWLGQHGYHAACIGKWHLGFTVQSEDASEPGRSRRNFAPLGARTPDGPLTRGFDYFYGVHHARSMRVLFENDRVAAHVEPVDMLPRLARRAADYVTERGRTGQPFFLYFALTSPHTPIVPTPEWKGKSGLGDYADFVMQTDAAIGDVLAALDRAGVASNTLVIATSDNGCSPAAGIDKLQRRGHFPSAQFRGHKADIWDGGHRIPFFVRWPGRVRPGTRSDALVCLTDLMATTAEMLGARLPDTAAEDSLSFLPVLLGQGAGARTAIVHHSISGRFAIREGPWKLELCPGSGGWSAPRDAAAAKSGAPPVQLYDLGRDIGETRNLQAERPEMVRRLTRLLEECIAEGRTRPGARQENDARISLTKATARDPITPDPP